MSASRRNGRVLIGISILTHWFKWDPDFHPTQSGHWIELGCVKFEAELFIDEPSNLGGHVADVVECGLVRGRLARYLAIRVIYGRDARVPKALRLFAGYHNHPTDIELVGDHAVTG